MTKMADREYQWSFCKPIKLHFRLYLRNIFLRNPNLIETHQNIGLHIGLLCVCVCVTVTITAHDGYFIKGLLLQARRSDCSHPSQKEPVGVFRITDSGPQQHFKLIKCLGHRDVTFYIVCDQNRFVYFLQNIKAKLYPICTVAYICTKCDFDIDQYMPENRMSGR